MKKKLLALLLALAMVVGLAACSRNTGESSGSSPAPAGSGTPQASDAGGASGTGEAKDPSQVKIALVCTGAVNDGGWNASAYDGLMRIKDELGVEVAYSEKIAIAEVPNVLRTYARQGFNLIFGHGAEFGEPMSTVAPEFPEVQFVAVNASVEGENLSGTVYKFGECGYFCGMAAAMASETGKLGIIPPDDAPNNKADMDTYELGAKSVNPDIEVMVAYTGSWDDLTKGKECAESLISQGCDVLLPLGDAYSVGVFQACEAAGVKSMGWVSDQSGLSDTVICSGIQSNAEVYVETAKSFLEGTFVPGVNVYGMPNGAQGMSEFYGLTDEQAAEIEQAMQDYLDGKLEIPTLY